MKAEYKLTKSDILSQLSMMGIKASDTVMVHSSLRALGPVDGGGNGLIDALLEYLSEGLLLIPTHTWANVTELQPIYDVKKTVPCIGTLPRLAMQRPDGIRSLHTTHSMWACGRGAEDYVSGEEEAITPAPPWGAWARLAEVKAKILLVGVGNNNNTFIHSIDERMELPDRLPEESFETITITADGRRLRGRMKEHYCSKTNDVSQFYVNFDEPLKRLGAQKEGRLGNARVQIVDAKLCQEIVSRIYSRATSDIFTELNRIPEEWYL